MIRAILLSGMLWWCAASPEEKAPVRVPAPAAALPVSYLALGDSYTIGQSVSEKERFPAQTVALLKKWGIRVAEPVYLAQTGWTTSHLQAAIANSKLDSTYDLVTLQIGVNDQYGGMDTGRYVARFTQLLEKAISLAGGKRTHVFVLSIPDYSVTPFVADWEKPLVSREVDWFNGINKRMAEAYGLAYLDITPGSRECKANAALIARDKLHPSGLEYRKWARMLAPKMKAVLQ